MKVFGIVLLVCVALAQAQAQPTLGDVVSSICPEAAKALEGYTILSAAIASAADSEVPLPEGETPVLIAPSDAAFIEALTALGTTSDELLKDQEYLARLLSLHLAIPDGSTVEGTPLEFTEDGNPTDLAGLIAADGVTRGVSAGNSKATVENVIECADGSATIVAVDSVLLPALADAPTGAPTPAPAPAPAPTPSGPVTTTIAGLLDLACPSILDTLQGPDFSTLASLILLPGVADTEITIPEGSVILAAPTNAAFQELLPLLPPGAANDATLIASVLANHIAVSQNVAADFPAATLADENLQFWRLGPNGVPEPVSAADVAADPVDAVITTEDTTNLAAVEAVVACPKDNQWAFAIDKVLLPAGLAPAPTPAPAPAPAPAPTPSPSPKPVVPPPAPVSGAAGVRAAVAAVATVAAAALLA